MRSLDPKKAMIFFAIACLFQLHTNYCYANSSGSTLHSEHYRSFPRNTPEAVLTAFVEADLGDFYNRQNDDRYPLWWGLTERGGAPEGDMKLFIQSYKITGKAVNKKNRHVIVNLEMDVRAISLIGDPMVAGASKRDVTVVLTGTAYSLRERSFLEAVFGKGDNTAVLLKKADYGYVPKDKRKWVFPVRMLHVNGKWVIAMESVPPEVSYGRTLLDVYNNEISRKRAMNDMCTGKRGLDRRVMESYPYLMANKAEASLQNFKAEFCAEAAIKNRQKIVNEFINRINELKLVFVD